MTLILIRSKERCRFRKFLADLKKNSSSFTLSAPTCSSHTHACWALLLLVGLATASAPTSASRLTAGLQSASTRPIVSSHNNERYHFDYRPHQAHPSLQRQNQQAPEASATRHAYRQQHEQQAASFAHTSYEPRQPSGYTPLHRHTSTDAALGLDLTSADQLLEPMTLDAPASINERHNMIRAASLTTDDIQQQHQPSHHRNQVPSYNTAADESYHLTSALDSDQANENDSDSADRDRDDEPAADNSNERDVFLNNHKSHLRAMRDMFERRQLNNNNNQNSGAHTLGQSSQELSPIAIGLDPGSPFSMPPFAVGGHDAGVSPQPHHQMSANADGGPANGGGPALPFGLNPLPHLLGFQGGPYDGPQRGDQPAYTNHHAASSAASQDRGSGGGGVVDPELAPGQKVWPKIFRFTDGRINLSDFEKQKKVRLSSKNQHGENHIDSAPIMFDGRQLKRKSFLILHGGVFQGNRR